MTFVLDPRPRPRDTVSRSMTASARRARRPWNWRGPARPGRAGSSPANRPAAAADAARAGAGSRATTPRACSGLYPPGSRLIGSRPWVSSPVLRWNGRFVVPAVPDRIGEPRFPAEMAERRSSRRGQARRYPARDGNPARARGIRHDRHRHQRDRRARGASLRGDLLAQAGCAVDAPGLFRLLSGAWVEVARLWDEGRGFSRIRGAWLGLAAGLDGPVAVQTGERRLSGTFETIDEAGRLVVRLAGGTRVPVSAGEVHFGAAASAA